ncbi:hypothetical protein AOXY_G15859 [Acipenser oxyrinchus oxyrinchus]|uniref:BEN domain-containing protein n=1 Tax=Acipenser oxyrinchus oxyrinchus TaxID=40147 RepID=A0AAD8D7Z9_ACIOX|nr:hypothetical protein AOXY_G15859 [Acipenser oxyrinchus oxyrinchus]
MSAKQDRCDNILKKLKAAHEEADSEADQLMALKNKVEKLEEENNSLKHKGEIHPGSNVFAEELAWALTNKATSCTSFVRSLTLAVFDVETLVRSNLRGGRNKRQQDGERKDGLDSTKVHAIYAATLAKFPTATKSQIGSTINRKIAELRHNLRKQDTDKSSD